MTTFARGALVVGIALFLEGFAIFLLGRLLAGALRLPDAAIPLPVAILAIGWSFILSWYIQTIRFSLNLRGVIGLLVSAFSVLGLAGLSMGAGWFPLGLLFSGDLRIVAALGFSVALLLLLWWRGTSIARDDVTLDVVRNAFVRGVIIAIIAVAADPLLDARVVRLPMLIVFFGIGLGGLALSRFAMDASIGRISRGWLLAMGVSIGVVILLALAAGAAGVGGLDEATRAIVDGIGFLALWTIRPLLLVLGLIAAGLVAVGNWVSGFFGGGDLSGLELARLQIQEFHDSLREVESEGPPNVILTVLKWTALLVALALAGWVLYRMFRRRRLTPGSGAEAEIRESTFTLQTAGQDIADTLAGWVNWASNLYRRRPPPATPREVYHRMLEAARAVGYPRRDWQTPQEHRQQVKETLPDPPMTRIIRVFQRYFYGRQPADADPETMTALVEDLDEIQRH